VPAAAGAATFVSAGPGAAGGVHVAVYVDGNLWDAATLQQCSWTAPPPGALLLYGGFANATTATVLDLQVHAGALPAEAVRRLSHGELDACR
jgi:hypothetical protein